MIMKSDDKDKLNKCIEILDTTDLGLSLVWLWTWSTIAQILDDDSYASSVTLDEVWEPLCRAVEDGLGFSLDNGVEQHQEEVLAWMTGNKWITKTEID
jgi:hypothetical protein